MGSASAPFENAPVQWRFLSNASHVATPLAGRL
jgi:hypothetical protein